MTPTVTVREQRGFRPLRLVCATHLFATLRPGTRCVNAKLTAAASLSANLNVVPSGSLRLATCAGALPSTQTLAVCPRFVRTGGPPGGVPPGVIVIVRVAVALSP